MSDLLIAGLHVDLQSKAREHRRRAEMLGLNFIFTSGYRSAKEQFALYAKGREMDTAGVWHIVDPHGVVTNSMPSQAPHCRRAAYDLVPIVKERPNYDRLDLFAELGRIGQELGLVWGGSWPRFKDLCHFELANWRALPLEGA